MGKPEALPKRCPAITFAGHPGHLLVRCLLPAGHDKDHRPSWSEGDRND
jgi:hypothetical protein